MPVQAAPQLRLGHRRHRIQGAARDGQIATLDVGVLEHLAVHHRQATQV
jgi:hypothetical protein